jgi:hypothetical protein
MSPYTVGKLAELFPRANAVIKLDVQTLWSTVDDLNSAIRTGAAAVCASQHPDGA